MPEPLRVLILEDRLADVELMLFELRQAGFEPDWHRVQTESAFVAQLEQDFDIILADYHLPQFSAIAALRHLQDRGRDIPFIVVTGAYEEVAVECMKQGATDYLLKDRLARLGPAVMQALDQRRVRDKKRKAEEIHRNNERRFRALIENSSDTITLVGARGEVLYAVPSTSQALGYAPADLIGRSVFELVHPEDRGSLATALTQVVSDPSQLGTAQCRVRHRDGAWRYLEIVATNLLSEATVGGIVLNARDISERKELEEQLTRQAFYDSLTGLPNRALFMDRLQHTLARTGRRRGYDPEGVAVLFLDLDAFKLVNDSLGHGAGDILLAAVATRMPSCLRPGDTVARFGGDEFTILLDDVIHRHNAMQVAERILENLRRPFLIDGHEVFVTASIGIALSRPGRLDPSELLREADIALYRAKASGKAKFVVFDSSMNTGAVERLDLETDLRRAAERGELCVYYQPTVDLETQTIVGMEALIRWDHPRHGLIEPGDFIPIAEETGLILPIGRWVLQEACRQARAWQELAPRDHPLVVAVNLSGRQLQHVDLVREVTEVLETTGLEPSALQLEITESVLMDDITSTVATLQALRSLGVPLAIDDFGTGYSSLNYLHRFPVDTLKIDKSFVSGLDEHDGASAIVQAVATLGHALGMEVIAEGIETSEQLDLVRSAGCDLGQGFLFSRPVPCDTMQTMLAHGLTVLV